MNLTKKDRLLLINQYEIFKYLDRDNTDYYDKCIATLQIGATNQYHIFNGQIEEEKTVEFQEFIMSVLDMFSYMNNAYKQLSEDEKQRIDLERISYQEFDGNHEGEYYAYANYILENMNLYQSIYEERRAFLNSHRSMVLTYTEMLERLNESADKYNLTVDDLLRIIGE